jgi:hypothetical protein
MDNAQICDSYIFLIIIKNHNPHVVTDWDPYFHCSGALTTVNPVMLITTMQVRDFISGQNTNSTTTDSTTKCCDFFYIG